MTVPLEVLQSIVWYDLVEEKKESRAVGLLLNLSLLLASIPCSRVGR